MKFLICGVGSVGERHIRNLISLGYEDIILFRKRNKPLRTIKKFFPTYPTLKECLLNKPDIAIICNPTHLHIETAIQCAKANCNIFIEKPLSHNLERCEDLDRALREHKKIGMVGYMMRYHPCILKIQKLIKDGSIGKVVFFRSTWGEFLPDWHPWEDYRKTYAAVRDMGGGPALTLSHELDLALWLFGNVNKVVGISNYNSNLEIDTEHAIDILLRFENGITGNIHLDYIQKPSKRSTEIVGSAGRIEFDYYSNQVVLYTHEDQNGKTFSVKDKFDRNDMFINELMEFIDSVNLGKISPISITESMMSVDIAMKALRY
jgi:predicted dehydrogenase